jgi:hypothetical protein
MFNPDPHDQNLFMAYSTFSMSAAMRASSPHVTLADLSKQTFSLREPFRLCVRLSLVRAFMSGALALLWARFSSSKPTGIY